MTDVLNGYHSAIDGHNSAATTPAAADSPATPVATILTDDVKIRFDEQLDHAEPIPVKPLDVASAVPAVGTPADPASIPIDPPKGTPPPPTGELLPDVAMAEQQVLPKINGSHVDTPMADAVVEDVPYTNGFGGEGVDVHMGGEGNSAPPTVAGSASPSQSSNRRSADEMEDDSLPPPAKRARVDSEPSADFSSDAPTAATEPPMSATPVAATPAAVQSATESSAAESYDGPSTISVAQHKFMLSTIRSLKKIKDAFPFLRPVDPVLLNVPHYPSIIKHPMDLSTVERKLAASNPAKPDTNLANPRYLNAEQFIADIRLIFANAETFNGPDHDVTKMGKRVEAVFDKQIKQLPPPDEPKLLSAKVATPTPPPPPPPQPKKAPAQRRPSTSVPPIRRSDDNSGRPKREIHAPPPKDLAYATEQPKRTQRKRKPMRDDGTEDQLRYCSKILSELFNKKHWSVAVAFYEPVDWVKLEIPTYPKVIKKPMDMGTIRKKLEAHEYPNAQKFHDDFKLMIRNCFTFNPPGTPVNQAGIELQRLFDEKWKGLPPLHDVASEGDDEDEAEDDVDDERRRQIADMEKQMEIMRANIAKLKEDNTTPAVVSKKHKKPQTKPAPPPVASTSKPAAKPQKASGSASTSHKSSKKSKKAVSDDDTLSFDQKKELSEAISMLDGQKLERVIQIIHDGVPEIRDSTEEIELEIDSLPSSVLTKLYNFVIRPQRSAAASASATGNPKRSRAGKGGGTGGLKRKSMDEDVEAEKIRALEERMRLFDEGGGNASAQPVPQHAGHSSDSSSGSDSSGSDSE